ncbi:unnamed protein product [Cuscuta epithymum]|uniref:Carotenoid cleavage dioxygenase 7 n=1 Tax=Cuscuta epithymum TaxID=186058 RepID=A0AAV0DHA6_9ASTE|nr:unnamed protein product [Cuscuta epithymum]
MQPTICYSHYNNSTITPPKFSHPVKLPVGAAATATAQVSLPLISRHVSRAISIPTTTRAPIPDVLDNPDLLDDRVTAFRDYQSLFVSQRSEAVEPVALRVVEGAIPSDFPSGTYYLTGPGLFTDDHGSTVHPLDGHGYLRAFQIDTATGQVTFRSRYIQTEAHEEERDIETGQWRFTHRGPFSVLRGGKMIGNTKVMKNVANTSVMEWGGRLFCLWEGGDPYEIDSTSLQTIGKFKLVNNNTNSVAHKTPKPHMANFWDVAAQILRPILYGVFKMSPKRFLSHYKIDGIRNRLVIMSCDAEDMLLPRSTFTFYEFDANFKLLDQQEFSIPDHLMIHDWALTDYHYVLFGNRIKLDVPGSMRAVCGLSPMISALSVNPSKQTSPVYLLPRFPQSQTTHRDWKTPIEVPLQMWVLHVGNAFEHKDEKTGNLELQIQASACSYRWFNFQKMFGYDWKNGILDPSMMNRGKGEDKLLPHLYKVSISLDRNGDCQNASVNDLNEWGKAADFPAIHPDFSGRKNSCVYAATSSGSRRALPHFPFDTVVKLNTANKTTQTWSSGRRRFIGEPVFVPKGTKDEDDGYLLVVEYAVSTHRCYLVVLDAKEIGKSKEIVAKAEVPAKFTFPMGFHGFWSPSN